MSFVVRPVSSFQDLCGAFGVVYEEYLKEGYQDKHPSKMRYTYHQLFPQSYTFIAVLNGKIVGTGSVVSRA